MTCLLKVVTRREGRGETMMHKLMVNVASLAVCAGLSAPVYAQDISASGVAPEPGDEIVVTAQRRAQSQQDVPIAITQFSGENLEQLSVDSAVGLQRLAPGFNFQSESGSSQLTIRGVGTGYSGQGLEQSVALYYNGSYIASQIGAVVPLIDIAQIQVLNGPQGALYGRNATGGAVLIDTNDPDTGGFGGYAKVGYGNFDRLRAEGVLNVPLGKVAAARFVGQYDRRDSFVHNERLDRDLYGQRSYYGRGEVLFEPSSAFKMVAGVEYYNDRREAPHINIAPDPICSYCDALGIGLPSGFYKTYSNDFVSEIAPFVGARRREITGDTSGEVFTRVLAFNNRATLELGALTLQSVTGYRQVKADGPNNDQDAGPNPLLFTASIIRNKAFNQEFQLSSDFDGDTNFIVGTNYEHDRNRYKLGLFGALFGPLIVVTDSRDQTKSFSVFGEVYQKFLTDFTLTVGGRYTKDKRRHAFTNNPDAVLVFGETGAVQRASYNSFTPRVVLAYDAGNANYYASFNRGVKAGGFNSPSYNSAPPVDPEKITAYEIGAKYVLLDRRLRLNIAAFHYDWSNLQVAVIDSASGGLAQENAAAAKADGAEISINASVGSAWTISANGLYLDSRYASFPSASVFEPNYLTTPGATGQTQGSADLRGFATPNAPKLSGTLTVNYNAEVTPGGWVADVTGSVSYKSKFDQQPGAGGSARLIRQDPFALANLRFALTDPSGLTTVAVDVQNLTKAKFYSNRVATVDGAYGIPGAPRTIEVSLKREF